MAILPLLSFILPAAGLTTLAACPAAPAARARACVPGVPARPSPASARARPCRFPSSLASASSALASSASASSASASSLSSASASGLGLASACGLGPGLALGLDLRLGLLLARASLAGSQLVAVARVAGGLRPPRRPFVVGPFPRRSSPSLFRLWCLSGGRAKPSWFSGRGWRGLYNHARRRPGRRPPSWVSRARRSCSLKAGRWGARAFSC